MVKTLGPFLLVSVQLRECLGLAEPGLIYSSPLSDE